MLHKESVLWGIILLEERNYRSVFKLASFLSGNIQFNFFLRMAVFATPLKTDFCTISVTVKPSYRGELHRNQNVPSTPASPADWTRANFELNRIGIHTHGINMRPKLVGAIGIEVMSPPLRQLQEPSKLLEHTLLSLSLCVCALDVPMQFRSW